MCDVLSVACVISKEGTINWNGALVVAMRFVIEVQDGSEAKSSDKGVKHNIREKSFQLMF